MFGNVRSVFVLLYQRATWLNAQLYSFVFVVHTVRVSNSSDQGIQLFVVHFRVQSSEFSSALRACGFLEQTRVPIHIHGPIAHVY
jgi:hypothetical protein